jgi:hypothetical protein
MNDPTHQAEIQFNLRETTQTNIMKWAVPEVVGMLPEEVRGKEVPATTTTTATTGVVVDVSPEVEEDKEVSGMAPTTTTSTPEGRKRKTIVIAEGKGKKFVFNKRGKLKVDEIKELARTNKYIFSWLKPTPPPMPELAKVMEIEQMDSSEYMDVVDTVQEEILERVRLRQLEWLWQVIEMADSTVLESERMVCSS